MANNHLKKRSIAGSWGIFYKNWQAFTINRECGGEVKDKVKGYSDDFLGTSKKNLIQLGKNAAVEKKGNTIIMSNYKQHSGIQSALFKIYVCK